MIPASDKKRRAARREGDVPASPLVPAAAGWLGAAVALATTARGSAALVAAWSRRAFAGDVELSRVLYDALALLARVALPVVVAAWLLAALAGAAQTRGLFTLRALRRRQPDDDGARSVVGWLLALGFVALLATVLRDLARALAHLRTVDQAARLVAETAGSLAPRAVLLLAAFALGDLALRWFAWERALQMTRAEVERERREEEGDPRLRAERRRRHRALAGTSPAPPKT
jgi:flagellar biosynthesis protein FlhB